MRNEVMESLMAEEKGSLPSQNSPFCRRLRIEEPTVKKPKSSSKKITRCLFGVSDPIECRKYANSAAELDMLKFKSRWSFDPMTGEPTIDSSTALDSVMKLKQDLQIYKWEQVWTEELIQNADEQDADTPTPTPTPAPKTDATVLQVTPTSEFMHSITVPAPVPASEEVAHAFTTTDTRFSRSKLDMTEVPFDLFETSLHEDFHSIETDCGGALMETVSPREIKYKSPRSMKQGRITDYMQVIKKPRAKKLR